MDFDCPILVCYFDENVQSTLNLMDFELEDSHAAPEPSRGCWIRTDADDLYALLWLIYSKKLLVTAEVGRNRKLAAEAFLHGFPQLRVLSSDVDGESA
jgi:hypothetical protein